MKLRKFTVVLLLAAGTLCLLAAAALARDQARLSGKLIRLHVVADSDGAADQARKLAVRDRLLDVISAQQWGSRAEAAAWLRDNLVLLESAGRAALPDGEALTLTLDDEWYPTREYETFSLPPGSYLSLRAVIGAGEGHNWWCVVYPTLCAVPDAAAAARAGGLTADETALITRETPAARLRFRLWELFSGLFADA